MLNLKLRCHVHRQCCLNFTIIIVQTMYFLPLYSKIWFSSTLSNIPLSQSFKGYTKMLVCISPTFTKLRKQKKMSSHYRTLTSKYQFLYSNQKQCSQNSAQNWKHCCYQPQSITVTLNCPRGLRKHFKSLSPLTKDFRQREFILIQE